MNNLEFLTKRQIEILGICLPQCSKKPLRMNDLSRIFDVDIVTIKRDLKALRDQGIDIHSTRKEGMILGADLDMDSIFGLLREYAHYCRSDLPYERSTKFLVEKVGPCSLKNIVLLKLCKEKKLLTMIDYCKSGSTAEKDRLVKPALIFQVSHEWRLLAENEGKLKQFLVAKISAVHPTEEKYEEDFSGEIKAQFRNSWQTWMGTDEYHIRLWLSKKWYYAAQERGLDFLGPEIRKMEKGGIFETRVNCLSEIAAWILSRGKGAEIIKPEELKESVLNLAREVIGNYQ